LVTITMRRWSRRWWAYTPAAAEGRLDDGRHGRQRLGRERHDAGVPLPNVMIGPPPDETRRPG
jgi:hypothetical protein